MKRKRGANKRIYNFKLVSGAFIFHLSPQKTTMSVNGDRPNGEKHPAKPALPFSVQGYTRQFSFASSTTRNMLFVYVMRSFQDKTTQNCNTNTCTQTLLVRARNSFNLLKQSLALLRCCWLFFSISLSLPLSISLT